ncbi:hypothetical protein D3C73_982160 [compost metagenome]
MQANVLKRQRLLQLHRLRPSQRMPRRHHQYQSIGTEMHHLQPSSLHWPGDNPHISAAVQYSSHDISRHTLLQIDRHRRPLRQETCQHFRKKFGHCSGVGKNPYMPGRVSVVSGELRLQIIHLTHN